MEIQNDVGINRRELTKGALALGGAAMFSAAVLGATTRGGLAFARGSPFKNDVEVLNYALTLEFFEAELYRVIVASGKLQGKDQQYAQLFGQHEQAHVDAIIPTIQKLGGTPIKAPELNLPALTDRMMVLTLLESVEQTGISAYQGAAGFIQSEEVLAAAASIMQVEARHTALIRALLGTQPAPDAFTKALTPAEVLMIVAPFLKQ